MPRRSQAVRRISAIILQGGERRLNLTAIEDRRSRERAHYAQANLEASRGKQLRRRGRAIRTERTTGVSEGE